MAHCGHCSISRFLKELSLEDFKTNMEKLLPTSDELQKDAWVDCYQFLKEELTYLSPGQQQSKLIFEYELENQTRPDILILTGTRLIILEFKSGRNAIEDYQSHYDQVLGYSSRFKNYHVETYKNDLQVEHFLVYTNVVNTEGKARVLVRSNFKDTISSLIDEKPFNDPGKWIQSMYEPTPDILRSVDAIFTKEDLPSVMTSRSNINEVLKEINGIVNNSGNTLNVIFVSGDPGAGKTLLGLKLVKDNNVNSRKAIYLTGNEPLCLVLQHEINRACEKKFGGKKEYGDAYVKRALDYLNAPIDNFLDYNQASNCPEDLLIFDEGQRAWDNKKIQKSINFRRERKGRPQKEFPFTEGDFLIWLYARAVENLKSPKTIICLIGDGQEIHDGEEMGIKSWLNQLRKENKKNNITIYAPSKYNGLFSGLNVTINDVLHLDTYHRGHTINEYPQFVNAFLGEKTVEAREHLKVMKSESKRYPIYVTQSLGDIKRYFSKDKYNLKKYGIISSSFSKDNLQSYGITPLKEEDMYGYSYRAALGNWYSGGCRDLNKGVTEFDSQGLEVDFPILFWGEDLIRQKEEWVKHKTTANSQYGKYDRLKKFDNPLQILKNIYRVLLTRGREGIILWIPYQQYPILEETYEYFKDTLDVQELLK